ncbi:FecR family protein [Dinghuibacter silviterrae]|uniref:FecR family protein n=1 Tax=Dinghuibacter silviterrae TaxID=1539049 RepID=A0A4R8DTI2_9BACT|nr:FecR family protein [Dinghuibacter silviterrae]TDX01600.1 FecR family protein [Dinghuibacter silviterrae]
MTQAQALEFVTQLASGNYTTEELDVLQAYLREAPRQELHLFFDAYYEAIRALPDSGPVDPEFQQRLYNLYPGEDDAGAAPAPQGLPEAFLPRTRPLWAVVTGIAAALALVIVTASVWSHRAPEKPVLAAVPAHHPAPAPVIQPGGNKAILTLSNGEQVVLDNEHRGSVVNQGGVNVVKTGDGSLAYHPSSLPAAPVFNMVSTPRGGQYEVTLPDGSRVWLNAASSLRFPTAFVGATREVEVTGEAYFEVTKDPKRPFTVKTPGLDVDVLGTDFNINTYSDESVSRATLLNGSIRVKGRVLQPREQAVVSHTDGGLKVIPGVDEEETVAWKNGNLQFNDADIPTILRQVARWYDVDIVYEGKVPQEHFTGRVSRDTDLSGVLHIFALSQIHFRIEGRKIVVTA